MFVLSLTLVLSGGSLLLIAGLLDMSVDGSGRADAGSDYPIGGAHVHDCPECGEPCDCEQTVCDHLCKVYGDSEAAQADEARETEVSEGES